MEKVIQLDTTNKCNLKCIFCNKYLNQNCQPETFFMSVKEAKKLLYENEDYLAITLQNNGEFFLNPEWEKILELTFKRASEKKCKIILATNGTLVNREKASVICELAELYKAEIYITVSINVLSSELYQKIMGYNLCEQVIENTEYLIEYSNKKTEFVNVSVQFMVMEKTAGKEAEAFINFWKDFFEKKHIEYDIVRDGYPSEKRFLVSLRRCYTGKREDFYTYENELKRLKNIFNIKEIKEKIETCDNVFKRKICSYLFEAPVVRDNIKCICCRDLNFENSFNLDNPAASEIEKYYKSIHYTGYFEKINVCNYCLNFPYVDEYKQYNKFCCDFAEKSYFNRLKKGVSFDFYNIDFSDNDEKKRAELFLKNNNYNALC
ncbi:MAG: radical SAM protein, partial [Candidatus Muiribacteriota bacterium]